MTKIKVINKQKVNRIPNYGGAEEDKRPIAGYDVCPELYANIFICSRKNSGKTTIIHHILKNCATKDTTVIIFSSTAYKDKSMIGIRRYLKNKKIPCLTYNSIMDDDVNRLEVLFDELKEQAKEEDEIDNSESESEEENVPKAMFKEDSEDSDDEKPRRKSKYQAPEHIIVLDDLSDELKMPIIVKLLKENRHLLRCKFLISSQYVKDILPSQMKNVDEWILMKGLSEEQIEHIYKHCQASVDFPTFMRYYLAATSKNKFDFFCFLPNLNDYRQNFNHKIIG